MVAVITGIPLTIHGQNTFVNNVPQPNSDGEFTDINTIVVTGDGRQVPFLRNETEDAGSTGVSQFDPSKPVGYLRNIVTLWYDLITFKVTSGEPFTDAVLYGFFFLPLGLTIIHSAIDLIF